MITTRSAQNSDAQAMTELLNTIIDAGGTTAHETTYSTARMITDYIDSEDGISCVVAEENGEIVGFQSLEWPGDGRDEFPQGWAIIATFVASGKAGMGIGKTMFLDTEMAAAHSGIDTIDAAIRSDNLGGLRYYSGLGFSDYKVSENVPLADGTKVDRISKRYDIS